MNLDEFVAQEIERDPGFAQVYAQMKRICDQEYRHRCGKWRRIHARRSWRRRKGK